MENRKKDSDLEMILAILAAGIAGEILFVDAGWGLGASLWVVGLGLLGTVLRGNWKIPSNTFIFDERRYSR